MIRLERKRPPLRLAVGICLIKEFWIFVNIALYSIGSFICYLKTWNIKPLGDLRTWHPLFFLQIGHHLRCLTTLSSRITFTNGRVFSWKGSPCLSQLYDQKQIWKNSRPTAGMNIKMHAKNAATFSVCMLVAMVANTRIESHHINFAEYLLIRRLPRLQTRRAPNKHAIKNTKIATQYTAVIPSAEIKLIYSLYHMLAREQALSTPCVYTYCTLSW